MQRKVRDFPARIRLRPKPDEWGPDELLTLPEAAALFFPDGPLTLSSLRTAAAAGDLAVARVAGKDLTTPRAIKKMVTPLCREKEAASENHPGSTKDQTTEAGSSSMEPGKSAQAAARIKLRKRRERLKNISGNDTPLQPDNVIPLESRSRTS